MEYRTVALEKQQEDLQVKVQKEHMRNFRILSCCLIYAVALSIFFFLQLPLPYLEPFGNSLSTTVIELAIVLFLATAIAIQSNLRIVKKCLETASKNEKLEDENMEKDNEKL